MYQVIINKNSHRVLRQSERRIRRLLDDSGISFHRIDFVQPEDLARIIRCRVEENEAPILIGGGDGTILQAAHLLISLERPFGIIPLGTMNLLAQDLGIPLRADQALRAYRHYEERKIDVSLVNNVPFLCAAGIRLMPEASRIREAGRRKTSPYAAFIGLVRVVLYVIRRLNDHNERNFIIHVDGQEMILRTNALVVTNNVFTKPDRWAGRFKKKTLRFGILGLYSIQPQGIMEKMRIIWHLLNGRWTEDPAVNTFMGRDITIASKREKEPVSVDGEVMTMETPLRFSILHEGMTVLVPARRAEIPSP